MAMQESQTLENEIEMNPIFETLVHGYAENFMLDNKSNKIIELATLEQFHPLNIFQEKYSEELNFPTLFY